MTTRLLAFALPAALIPCYAATQATAAHASSPTTTGAASTYGVLAAKVQTRIRLSVVPEVAYPGQSVTLKGRVLGPHRAKKVKIHVSGLATIRKKIKQNGKFHANLTAPADQRIKACVGHTCKTTRVGDPPDAINVSWSDGSGYSYRSSTTGLGVTGIAVDVASAAPGNANISFYLAGDEAITNTTPGHNAPVPRTFLIPVFPSSSMLCQSTSESAGNTRWATIPTYRSDGLSDYPMLPFCTFRGAPNDGPISGTLAPGQTAHNDFSESAPGYPYQLRITVPQELAQTIATELANPSFWGLSLGSGSASPAGVCIANLPLLATSRGGLSICAQGIH